MEKKTQFLEACLPLARKAGAAYRINPVVILAQAALETGWGTSTLARLYNNFFGITGYGKPTDFWPGHIVKLSEKGLPFRSYPEREQGFMDYARLIRSTYSQAADLSQDPEAFARAMASSAYISEENGDNREVYRKSLVSISRDIAGRIAALAATGKECVP
ncbi:MAG: glucosaminidase domain-containing protein [Tannerellaceae bacterium]|nr:glucosaminidase domain-containing protein [Tannerellaceae bacterium]